MNNTTASTTGSDEDALEKDITWILTSSFIIFTMQSGFGLLEAGSVSSKNEVNIMVKNVVDVVFGGLTYWMFGHGLSFGKDAGSNPFCGVGLWFVDSDDDSMGVLLATFVFYMSFATTSTTIVSGAMAERTRLMAYMVFSLFNTFIYCFPAHWMWAENGFLKRMGAVDFAGSGVVHMTGAMSGLVGTVLLRPRLGRFDPGAKARHMSAPSNAILGMFMLWWGWLGFNCGSTLGISGRKWQVAAKTAATTLVASFGGGCLCIVSSYFFNKKKYDVEELISCILAALVAITASCAMVRAWEAIIIGAVGAVVALLGIRLLDRLKVDDPVGAVPVHGMAGLWGLLAVGLFVEDNSRLNLSQGQKGLFHGGGARLLGMQVLSAVCVVGWTGVTSTLLFLAIDKTIGLRLTAREEILGSDIVEHDVGTPVSTPRPHISSPVAVTPIPPGDRRWSCAVVTPSPRTAPQSPSKMLVVPCHHGDADVVAIVRRRVSLLPEDRWSLHSVMEMDAGTLANEKSGKVREII